MIFRNNDKKAKEEFAKKGVPLWTGYADIDGCKLYYARTGNETFPTLFFVHGSPDKWSRYWQFMIDSDLWSKYRMIAIDRPGSGHSRIPVTGINGQVNLISSFLRLVENKKPVFGIGHSYGGALILGLEASSPGLFDALVLLAAALDPQKEKAGTWTRLLNKAPLRYFLPRTVRTSNHELVELENDLAALARQTHKINCPVWIMHGDKDNLVSVSNVDYAKKILTKSTAIEIQILKGANHFITNERFSDVKHLLASLPC
jgi:pimeloyl-ACP methyl ester carboxylesterase